MEESKDIVFQRNTIEFVTVAAEYCAFLEKSNNYTRKDFVATILKILPLLYLKAQMLPDEERLSEDNLQDFVSEDSYEILRMNLAELLTDKDTYLDVFVEEMKYSDTPITKNISEDLADIYQDIKNFVCLFQTGINETMHDAIIDCNANFREYWGQKLVNTQRALHEIAYKTIDEEEEDSENDNF